MDIGLTYTNGIIDLDLGDGGSSIDQTLKTAVIISLFTDRRAEDGDILPDGGSDRRGWWGDNFADVDQDKIGSRLWLLSREKQLPSVMRRAEQYAREALAWLVDDGVATALEVSVSNPVDGALALAIVIRSGYGSETPLNIAIVSTAAAFAALVDTGYDMILDQAGGILFDLSA